MSSITVRTVGSLQKVFLNREPLGEEPNGQVFANGSFSYQVAFRCDAFDWNRAALSIQVESALKPFLEAFVVENIPCQSPCGAITDDRYEATEPGLYPDALIPLEKHLCRFYTGSWYSLWICVNQAKQKMPSGKYPIRVTLCSDDTTAETVFSLTILPEEIPTRKLHYTNWFHADSICDAYNVKMFSEKHWKLMGQFMRMAAEHGQDMILVPAFTPPLDTPVGAERMTAQLIDVTRDATGAYIFAFDKLERYIRLAQESGFTLFEHSHLFTQWGAKHCPKIVASVKGRQKRIFGWDTSADDPEYKRFLSAYFDALIPKLRSLGVLDAFSFHVSDEPNPEDIGSYKTAREIMAGILSGHGIPTNRIMDALSDYSFVEQGLIEEPVVMIPKIKPFLRENNSIWMYYTGGETKNGASNRLISMTSGRTRILGTQLYRFRAKGFLHWGFNFYYNYTSDTYCNPFCNPDASRKYSSGTSYIVYPALWGPTPSIRAKVFSDGLDDLNLLEYLETLSDRDHVLTLIRKHFGELTMTTCPAKNDYTTLKNFRVDVENEIHRLFAQR